MKAKTGMIIKQLLGNGIHIELPTIELQVKIITLAFIVQIIIKIMEAT